MPRSPGSFGKNKTTIQSKSKNLAVEKKTENPLISRAKKSVGKEIDEKTNIMGQMESLAQMAIDLAKRREEMSLRARKQDIEYVEKLDTLVKTVLDALISEDSVKAFAAQIPKLIADGQLQKLTSIMTSLGIAIDKREMFLSFDQTRAGAGGKNKSKLKLNLLWKGGDGEPMGVQAEVTEGE
jgi:hypothetical protein